MEILKYPQIDTSDFQFISGSEIKITLADNYLEYFAWSDNKVKSDETGLWETKKWYNKYHVTKAATTSIEIVFSNEDNLYYTKVSFSSTYFVVYFKTRDEANALYKKLTDWRNN